MRQDKESFHGVKISRFGIRNGYIDYHTLAQAAGAEPYDMNEDGYWELVNGDDISYSDSEGNVYDSLTALERVRELENMVAGAEEGQDVSRWKRDIQMLLCEGKEITVHEYCKVSKEGARILMDESDELVFYNPVLDVYVWGICHQGISWEHALTGIPIPAAA